MTKVRPGNTLPRAEQVPWRHYVRRPLSEECPVGIQVPTRVPGYTVYPGTPERRWYGLAVHHVD
eukprot:2367690-Rhodomonas_salina.1